MTATGALREGAWHCLRLSAWRSSLQPSQSYSSASLYQHVGSVRYSSGAQEEATTSGRPLADIDRKLRQSHAAEVRLVLLSAPGSQTFSFSTAAAERDLRLQPARSARCRATRGTSVAQLLREPCCSGLLPSAPCRLLLRLSSRHRSSHRGLISKTLTSSRNRRVLGAYTHAHTHKYTYADTCAHTRWVHRAVGTR